MAKAKLGAMQVPPLFTTKQEVKPTGGNGLPTVADTGSGKDSSPDTGSGTDTGSQQAPPERIKFGGDVRFQKASAGVVITVLQNGDSWRIVDFQVNSPLFKMF